MNDLRGKYVNVVLGVEEGKGMDFLKHPVYIVAHFSGRIMESDCVEPLSTPDFNTELVWETEKKTIRKVRSTNSPLRVECFSIDEYSKKECIGFTLLSLRSANIIPANRPDIQIPIKWYKLIGVPAKYKKSHPELYLSLTLRDHCINSTLPPAIPTFPDALETPESNETKIIPVKFVEGGYIQVGEDQDNEKFELKITIKLASNLDLLLPRDVVFAPNIDKFYMSFNLFGITINTKSFYRDLHETIILNENIIVKLQSTFDVLKMFFGQFYEVIVHFHHGTKRLASTKINMEKLIPLSLESREFKDNHKGKIMLEEMCIFHYEPSHPNMFEAVADRKPLIQIETQISTENEKIIKVSEKKIEITSSAENTESNSSITKDTIQHMDGCGDRNKKNLSPICEGECLIDSPKKIFDGLKVEISQTSSDYQQYSLDIILESLVWKSHTSTKKLIFKFKHPRASTFLSIKAEIENSLNRKILLESVHCKLVYLTTSDNIFHLLEMWKPILLVEDKNGIETCSKHHFQTEKLKEHNDHSYTVSLMDSKGVIMDLKIWMCVQNIGLLTELSRENYLLEPHVLDEFLTLKELGELTKWKDDVQGKFVAELKVKEKEQLDKLMLNWNERKTALENKLIANISRCKHLSKELQKGTNMLKIQKTLQEKERNIVLEKVHEEVRKNAVKYSLNENADLLGEISNVERENANLKEMLAQQSDEMNSLKKCSLSNQQTATLLQEVRCLQEKYVEAQKVKSYFKDQYAKAVKEIHQLKTEGRKNIQDQLQVKKEELSQLSLDKFFEVQNAEAYEFSEEMLNSEIFKGDAVYGEDEEYDDNIIAANFMNR